MNELNSKIRQRVYEKADIVTGCVYVLEQPCQQYHAKKMNEKDGQKRTKEKK